MRRPGSRKRKLSRAELAERARCSNTKDVKSFVHWCESHVKVEGADGIVPFILWPGQKRLAPMLVKGLWPIALKGRQVGFTWLIAAWALWLLVFRRQCRIFVVAQERMYAEEFIRRVRFMWEELPRWCRPELIKDTEKRLRFATGGMGSEIMAIAGGSKAARSLTGDIVIFDEASRIRDFAATLAAAQPAMEKRNGQMVVLSTSAGPIGGYYELWKATFGDAGELLDEHGVGPTGFSPVFIHWSEAPDRDQAWFRKQCAVLDVLSLILRKQEFPNSIAEAWEFAAGRVHPAFGAAHVGRIKNIGDDFVRYRGVDWGETKSAYVVLWGAVLHQAPPALLVSPACPNTIRELTNYRFDEDTKRPMKGGNHTCDVIRYMVVTFGITGLLYIYREIYITESIAKGWTPMKQIADIHEQSGWVRGDILSPDHWAPGRNAEKFEMTVCDRSIGALAALYREHQIAAKGHKRLTGLAPHGVTIDGPYEERLAGFQMVNNLIDGTEIIEKFVLVERNEPAVRAAGLRVASSLDARRKRMLARQLLKKSLARRR